MASVLCFMLVAVAVHQFGCRRLPRATALVYWTFEEPGEELVVDVTIHDDPGEEVGLYFSPYCAEIDSTTFYFGIQTNVSRPQMGNTGKGLIFSRWDTRDLADLRTAGDGFHESAGYEGDFVSVRRNVDWSPGTYTIRLYRAEQDGDSDWFELEFTDHATNQVIPIGALRFPRADTALAATIQPRGAAFTEIYSGVRKARDVPTWHVDLRPRLDGISPTMISSKYPSTPRGRPHEADVWYVGEEGRVHMTFGHGIERRHDAGVLHSQ